MGRDAMPSGYPMQKQNLKKENGKNMPIKK